MTLTLRDCPLCGSRAMPVRREGYDGRAMHGVSCTGCFLEIPCKYRADELAAGAWNRRMVHAPRIALRVVGEVK